MVHESAFAIPVQVVSMMDLGRLERELLSLDDFILQTKLRGVKDVDIKLPPTSQMMARALELNRVNVVDDGERATFKLFIESVRDRAPILHMSFSADPSPDFTEKLVAWIRQNVHPLAMLRIGLMPNIGAGVILRTTNKQFDFSLLQDMKSKRELLFEAIGGTPKVVTEDAKPAVAVAGGEQ